MVLPGTKIPLVSVYQYHSKANRILLDFKFNNARGGAHSIGYTMGEAAVRQLGPPENWLFCCVPMTDAQLRQRGYNQSALLASAAARWVGASCDNALLRKCRDTETQHSLSAAKREANVVGAFELAPGKHPQENRILLCDDIATTGATLRACAEALTLSGVNDIVCLTYLRT
jgi:ComF family protein